MIWCVEDDPSIREIEVYALNSTGLEARGFADGKEFWKALEEETPEYPAEDGKLSILYEDEALLAVDKPAGMLIHPSRSKNTGTLANFVAGYYQ